MSTDAQDAPNSTDFVPAGSPPGWYESPTNGFDYYYTGKGFGTVKGEHVRRIHPQINPPFVPAGSEEVAEWVRTNGVDSTPKQFSSLGVRHGDSAIPLTTGPSIPGRVTSKVLGLVFGAGNAAWTIEGTSGKAGTALEKASQSLVNEARSIGADAVVSITFSMDGSGNSVNRSQTITLLGTAVRLEATSEPQSGAGRHVSGPDS